MRLASDYNNGKLNTMIDVWTKAIKMTTLTLLCPEAKPWTQKICIQKTIQRVRF